MIDYNKIIKTEENLIAFIYSYNWDDGFEIPYKILEEKECTLQVALLIFDLADGYSYLQTKGEGLELPEWSKFISNLYNRVLNGEFKKGNSVFNPNLTKVQIYKLKKQLSTEECVFIIPINLDTAVQSVTEDSTESINLCQKCVRKNYQKPKLCVCNMCENNTLTKELNGASLFLSCSNCGYEVIGASFFPPCSCDKETYSITIRADDIKEENKLKVSKCLNLGIVELSKFMSENNVIEIESNIDKSFVILTELKNLGIPFSVTPDIIEKYPELIGCKFILTN